jgi:hypothetical protein
VAGGIVEDGPLATGQTLAQVDLDVKAGAPGAACLGLAPDLDVDRLGRDALVRCDRSEGEDNSTAQRGGDQLDRAGVGPVGVVAAVDFQDALTHANLGPTLGEAGADGVFFAHALNAFIQSQTVTPGVSTWCWA